MALQGPPIKINHKISPFKLLHIAFYNDINDIRLNCILQKGSDPKGANRV